MPIRVLHVEVGGTYGGSVKALETYLLHSHPSPIQHHVVFYYPTPGIDKLTELARVMDPLLGSDEFMRLGRERNNYMRSCTRLIKPLRNGAQTAFCIVRILKLLARHNYDAIHVNNTFTYQPATIVAGRLCGMKVIGHARNPVPDSRRTGGLLRLLTSVIAVNRSIANDVQSRNRRVPVHCCYDGITPPRAEKREVSLRRASLASGDKRQFLIGSVGRLHAQKGFDDFVRAARIVADVYPQARFAIAGDGPGRAELERLIAILNLREVFRLLDFQADVGSFLGALDLFVCSSRWEGGPFTVVEALALGKPIVSTAVGFVPELLQDRLVPPGDPQALAARMIEAIARPETPATIDAARSRAATLTNPRTNARRLDDLLYHYAAT